MAIAGLQSRIGVVALPPVWSCLTINRSSPRMLHSPPPVGHTCPRTLHSDLTMARTYQPIGLQYLARHPQLLDGTPRFPDQSLHSPDRHAERLARSHVVTRPSRRVPRARVKVTRAISEVARRIATVA